MEHSVSVLFNLVRAAVDETPLRREVLLALSREEHIALYRLSKAHDLSHIVGEMLNRQGVPLDADISEHYMKQQMLAVYRYQRLQDTYGRLCALFEEHCIAYIPLKGAVIRPYYPEAWMRTSCDIDILVKEEDAERAVLLIEQTFGIKENYGKSFHDHSLLLEGGVHLELHFNIIEELEPMDTVLRKVWEYARPCDGTGYRYLQTNAYLLFHLVAHNAYHFIKGGCGLRPFLDWWLLRKKLTVDRAELSALLEEANLVEFATAMDALCDVWFEGARHTDLTQGMEDYLLGAGVYGSLENKVAVGKAKKGSGVGYLFSRLFLPMREMKKIYPVLTKAPFLYPFCTVARWFSVLFSGRGKRAAREIGHSMTSDAKTEAIKQMCDTLRLT